MMHLLWDCDQAHRHPDFLFDFFCFVLIDSDKKVVSRYRKLTLSLSLFLCHYLLYLSIYLCIVISVYYPKISKQTHIGAAEASLVIEHLAALH